MRKKLYEIIEVSQDNDRISLFYDILMMCAIIISIIPLAFKQPFPLFYYTDIITTGDIYPVTTAGRIITMISSFFGIAIVALPAGIITAGYMNALNKEKKDNA